MQRISSESIVGYKLAADGADGVNTVNTFVRIIGNTYNTRENTIRLGIDFVIDIINAMIFPNTLSIKEWGGVQTLYRHNQFEASPAQPTSMFG